MTAGKLRPAGNTLSARTPAPFARRARRVLLIVTDGPDAGLTAEVGSSALVVGTGASCELLLHDPQVSQEHMRVSWTGASLAVEDLASRNGCYAGSSRFERAEIGLGGRIRVGQTEVKVVPAEEAIAPDAADQPRFGSIVGASTAMRKLYTMIEQVADCDASVLIQGETGTGKELVAEELHRSSSRRDGPFVVVDCGSVPSSLIEGILFGHLRGAYTGADVARRGLFAEADGGTVFFDEIGELPIAAQASLLRAVDRGMIRPVGAARYEKVDVRIVAATHRHLPALIGAGEFREDLYYRLSTIRLSVPALRERTGDVDELARHFLLRLGRPDLALSEVLLAKMRRHRWPGNVRELRNVVETGAVLAGADGVIHLDTVGWPPAEPPTVDNPDELEEPFVAAKAKVVERFERAYLERLMGEHDTLTDAASAARMDRKHLRNLLTRYGLR